MASLEAILEGPGLKPPPGVVPNFVDPPSQSAANVATQSICMILGTVCVFIRLYTRFFIVRSHGWEDCKQSKEAGPPTRLTEPRYLFYRMGEI